jgi:PAS domain S-box-containing protein
MDAAGKTPPLADEGGRFAWLPWARAKRLSGGIGLRLLASVLLISSIVTLVLTVLQLYLDYRREVSVIEMRLDEIGRSSPGSLSEGVWNLDRNQVQAQLNGFLRLPDIRAAEVREIGNRPNLMDVKAGERAGRSNIVREFPLTYPLRGVEQPIGTLYVEATLTQVYSGLLERALIILVSQGAKTFIVSFFILYIVYWTVTRHLNTIAQFAGHYGFAHPPPPLRLERRPPASKDELDQVVNAINGFCASLQHAYDNLRTANQQLERDILAREQMAAELRASEQRFRDFAETASDWLWETGPDHRFTFFSQQALVYGYELSSLIGTRRELTASDVGAEREKWQTHLAARERHEPFRNFQYKRFDAGGRVRYVSTSGRPVFGPGGEFLGYRGTGTDMTEQREAEERLRASEQRFRDYAETASDWFWESGPDHTFTTLSEQARLFGFDSTVVSGTRREDAAIDLATEPTKWHEHLALLERHEPFRNFEYKRLDTTGRMRHVSVSGRPIFDASGNFLGYRGTATDLTSQREAEERLHQMQKLDSIGQLTGGVAHDFNNILTVITGTVEILIEGVGDRPQLAAIGRMIDEAATRGAALTQQLLAFARRQPLEPRLTDVNKLLEETGQLLRPTLGEHIEIEWMLAPEAWPALIDPSLLATALLNLAINARDAMPEGGKLTLETGNVILDQTYASTNPDVAPGPYVMIAISDTGTGIPAHLLAKVFEPFFTTKQVGKGTGLGLSMVYGFVKQSGGHIKIYSEVGQGTTIKLYLPRGSEEAGGAAEAVYDTADGGTETVLVVEDDELVRSYASAQLKGLGFTTYAASNAAEALAILESGVEIDLLFTDIIMPGGMNGRQLAEEVTRRYPAIAVLYTSGYTENAIVHQGRLDPGVMLLSKPYRRSDLARKIREALAVRRRST